MPTLIADVEIGNHLWFARVRSEARLRLLGLSQFLGAEEDKGIENVEKSVPQICRLIVGA